VLGLLAAAGALSLSGVLLVGLAVISSGLTAQVVIVRVWCPAVVATVTSMPRLVVRTW
jgi:hypothetical protein